MGIFRPAGGLWAISFDTRVYFGQAGDVPAPGRFSGGSLDEKAIFRPEASLWAVRGVTRCYFGRAGDLPATR